MITSQNGDELVSMKDVSHEYQLPGGKSLPVLSQIHFTLMGGELVAILGPSGCGKSTLIRMVAGLLTPNHGVVTYRDHPVLGPNPHTSLVFQQFALYPWLTVFQNIEQALIPRGIEPETRRQRVSEVISMIGLDGFEEAYPRELSGGMKQRVGIARALAVSPELLCMDEPFSQVDALTAETLRNEVVNLWQDREKYPQSILLVSHDIHEVAFMANRIIIMAANPGRIQTIIENPLAYPRDPHAPAYQVLVDKLHAILTGLYMPEPAEVGISPTPISTGWGDMHAVVPVPLVEVRDVIGLLEAISSRGGNVELFRLTEEIDSTFTSILLATKAAELMGFLVTPEDHLVLTESGKEFVQSPRKMRRQLFRVRLVQLPIIKRLKEMLERSPEHRFSKEILLEELAIQCPLEDPKRLFRILINWGKFAELWSYQSSTSIVSLVSKTSP